MLLSMGGMEQSVSPILLSTGTITDEKQVQDNARYSWQCHDIFIPCTFVISSQVQK